MSLRAKPFAVSFAVSYVVSVPLSCAVSFPEPYGMSYDMFFAVCYAVSYAVSYAMSHAVLCALRIFPHILTTFLITPPPPYTHTLPHSLWFGQLMAVLTDSCGSLRGGALASSLEAHLKHGDPLVRTLVARTLRRVCAPLVEMVERWVCEGELCDPHKEFFIVELSEGDEWHRHALRPDTLPHFLPLDLAKQVLVLGKSLYFMRRCCDISEGAPRVRLSAVASAGHLSVAATWVSELRTMVSLVGGATHRRLLQVINTRYNLRVHLSALKKFLLLGQGDTVVGLLDALKEELERPAEDMYHHALTAIVDGVLRSSNARFEPPMVLERLGVKLLKASAKDKGWEVFSLDYHIDAPLSAVVHPKAMSAYRRVFRLLWRLKRCDFVLSASWRQHMVANKMRLLRLLPELQQSLHEANLMRNRMWHLVQNLSNYMMFEVLEESWVVLVDCLDRAPDLDAVINAHDDYLSTILRKSMLNEDLRAVMEQLHCAFDTIIAFCAASDVLFSDAHAEVARAAAAQRENDERAAAGLWGQER